MEKVGAFGRLGCAVGRGNPRLLRLGLNGHWFFARGVIATVQLVMLVNLTAFAVVREREVGTLEQIR